MRGRPRSLAGVARIRVSVEIGAPPSAVWAAIEDIGTHVEWMTEAEAIRFTTEQRSGVGTVFDCDTRVGPLAVTDQMVVTEWEPDRVMGIRHVGVVTGSGRFLLEPRPGGRTSFTWDEELAFPLRLGGVVGGAVGAQVLRLVWRRNLAALKRRAEGAVG